MAEARTVPCIFCCNAVEADSKPEHIIPNALGGKLKTYHVCNTCNSKFSKYQRILTEALAVQSNWAAPKRDNKRKGDPVLNYSTSIEFAPGEKTDMPVRRNEETGDVTGNKIVVTPLDGGEYKIDAAFMRVKGGQINPDDVTKLEKIVRQILEKEGRPPEIIECDIQRLRDQLARVRGTERPIELHTQIAFTEEVFLPIEVMVAELYDYLGLNIKYIRKFLDEIYRTAYSKKAIGVTSNGHVPFYPPNVFDSKRVQHAIAYIGIPSEQILYAMVSLYGVLNCLIVLNDSYSGHEVREAYCFDIFAGKEVPFSNYFEMSKVELLNALKYDSPHNSDLNQRMMEAYESFLGYF